MDCVLAFLVEFQFPSFFTNWRIWVQDVSSFSHFSNVDETKTFLLRHKSLSLAFVSQHFQLFSLFLLFRMLERVIQSKGISPVSVTFIYQEGMFLNNVA